LAAAGWALISLVRHDLLLVATEHTTDAFFSLALKSESNHRHGVQWPQAFLVLVRPRQVFIRAAESGTGYGVLFVLLALELLIQSPFETSRHLAIMLYDPAGGLMGLYADYLSMAVKPAIAVYVLGIGLYYKLRKGPSRLEMWAAASVIAYAWVAHTVAVTLISFVLHFGVGDQLLTGMVVRVLAMAPLLALIVIAYRTVGRSPPEAKSTGPSLVEHCAMGGALLFLIVTMGLSALQVAENWGVARPVTPGDAVPSFAVRRLDGAATQTSRDLQGQVTLIDFWATWCGPCVAAMPHLSALERELGPQGLKILSINVEPGNHAGVQRFAREQALPFEVYVDNGSMQSQFKVRTFPSVFTVDRTGNVHSIHVGTTSIVTLRNEVEKLLSEGR